jgi:hypothetical protein
MSETVGPPPPDAGAPPGAGVFGIPAQTPAPHPPSTPDPSSLALLRQRVSGPVFVRGSDADTALADEAACWNTSTVHRPAVVVGATRAADVAAAVDFARAEGLSLAAQATGHGAASAFCDGVLVTTRRMSAVHVDPVARTARVGAGARWRDVIAATQAHGLAPLSGSASGVGVTGYTLGGGMGLLSRKHGFAADHVVSLEVVTADGRVRHVDATNERDLFWALRGGKGSFGVVTQLEIELFEVPELTAGAIVFAGEDAPAVLHAWRHWVTTLTDDTSTSLALQRLPDAPMVPEHLRGVLTVHLRVAHLGPQQEADAVVSPMRASATPLADDLVSRPYADADAVHRDPVDPSPAWDLGATLTGLDASAVDALLAVAGPRAESPLVVVELRLMGGAMARPPLEPNAVAGRDAAFSLMTIGPAVPGLLDAVPVAAQAVHEALAPWRSPTNLTNWLGRELDRERVCASWSYGQQARLRATKTVYDPTDLFSHGHSVLPSVSLAELADVDPRDRGDEHSAPAYRSDRYWDVEQCRWVRRSSPD